MNDANATGYGPWPQPHPRYGKALHKGAIVDLLGLARVESLDSIIQRGRAGTLLVPFPAHDGYALRFPAATRPVPYWWETTIDDYREAVKHRRYHPERRLTDDERERIRQLRRTPVDGRTRTYREIAEEVGVSVATVSVTISPPKKKKGSAS